MPHHLGADLDQLVAQHRQCPVLGLQRQRPCRLRVRSDRLGLVNVRPQCLQERIFGVRFSGAERKADVVRDAPGLAFFDGIDKITPTGVAQPSRLSLGWPPRDTAPAGWLK